jgi:CheY-like chemotaxis protein
MRVRPEHGTLLALARSMNDARRRRRGHLLLGFKTRARLVVADDDEQMRALLIHVLTEEGYEVIEAADGKELTELLQAGADRVNVDAVITDIRMPGMSGLDVLADLRTDDWSTPFIVITAFPDEDVAAESARLGAVAIFAKPFGLRELVSTIQSLLPARLG